jgi:hypothetical protein
MTENMIANAMLEILASHDEAVWQPTIRKCKELESSLFPELDIDLWLEHNAPTTFQQLADIRYALYHRCSRAGFVIIAVDDRKFRLTGRHSTLLIPGNSSRQHLLRKLYELGRKNKWINALPRTRRPTQ